MKKLLALFAALAIVFGAIGCGGDTTGAGKDKDKAKDAAKDKDDLKEKGTRMATAGFKWVQTNFSSIQFYSMESTVVDGESVGGAAEDTYSASFAMLIDDGKQAYFYFFKDLYLESKF